MARRKIAKAADVANGVDLAEVPKLTEKQLIFAMGVLSGLTATDAYIKAYDCAHWKRAAIWAEASKQANSPKVILWMDQAKLAGMSSAKVTYEGHVRELESLKTAARHAGNHGAAIQAEQLRGKATGLYVDQVRVQIDDPTKDPSALIESIAAVNEDYAAQLADDLGVAWHKREDEKGESDV